MLSIQVISFKWQCTQLSKSNEKHTYHRLRYTISRSHWQRFIGYHNQWISLCFTFHLAIICCDFLWLTVLRTLLLGYSIFSILMRLIFILCIRYCDQCAPMLNVQQFFSAFQVMKYINMAHIFYYDHD